MRTTKSAAVAAFLDHEIMLESFQNIIVDFYHQD